MKRKCGAVAGGGRLWPDQIMRLLRVMGWRVSRLRRKLAQGLTARQRERLAQRGLAENRQAIEDYNARIERNGVFGHVWRRF